MTEEAAADIDLAGVLDGLAAEAWPAADVAVVSGWLCRSDADSSRRANSVRPASWHGGEAMAEALREVEAFYRTRGLPARFQVGPAAQPAGLDERLDAQGYGVEAPTLVLAASVADVVAATPESDNPESATPESATPESGNIAVLAEPAGRWMHAYMPTAPTAEVEARRRLIGRIAPAHACFLAEVEGGTALGCGLGVAGGDWAGIFAMHTHPPARGRGHGTAVLGAIARWAASAGSRRLYTLVEQDNAGALRLYERIGFRARSRYHYRTRWPDRS